MTDEAKQSIASKVSLMLQLAHGGLAILGAIAAAMFAWGKLEVSTQVTNARMSGYEARVAEALLTINGTLERIEGRVDGQAEQFSGLTNAVVQNTTILSISERRLALLEQHVREDAVIRTEYRNAVESLHGRVAEIERRMP